MSEGDSEASDDEDAASVWCATDALESLLLTNCPLLQDELSKFRRLTRVQQMLVYLLVKNTKESTHVDYKTAISCSDNWRFRLLKAACAMYNGLDSSLREPSLTDLNYTSSYLVFGVKELDRKSCDVSKSLVPLDKYPGEEEIQDLFKNNTIPYVKVYLHIVDFFARMQFQSFGIDIPPGKYALLEVPKGDYGPALFKDCSARSNKAISGSKERSIDKTGAARATPGFLSYTRTDAQNVCDDKWDELGLRERVNDQFDRKYNFQGLFIAKEDLIQERNAFRVLVLSKFTGLADPQHREILPRALGQGKWDVIIDFDNESREQKGHFTIIEEEMRKQGRLFSLKSWNELSKTDPKDFDECQRGQRTICVQAMGCSKRCIDATANSNRLKKALNSKFLELIFEKNLTPKPVMCVTLCLTATTQEILNLPIRPDKIASFVKKAFVAESDNDLGFRSITLSTEESVRQLLTASRDTQDMRGELILLVPPSQLCFLFSSLYSSSVAKTSYELPGVSGPFSISREHFATYKPYLRLYHAQSGRSRYRSKSDDQRKQYSHDIRREFLAGNKLTKEMLHIHDELRFQGGGIYAERREMESLKETVGKLLTYRNDRSFTMWHSDAKQVIQLYYEPTSGATTIARIVLWRLRKENPCVEVINANRLQEAIEGICAIYESSKLPVLILFDSDDFQYSTVCTFVSELNGMRPITKFVVIFVDKVRSASYSPMPASRVLTVKLSDEETAGFERIYMESGGDEFGKLTDKVEKETDKTPFLFGVWHFKQDYKKMDDFIVHLLSACDHDKKKLLYFASLTQLFTHSPLHLSIAAQIFGIASEQKDPSSVLHHLGIQRHLLTVTKDSGIWGLTPILVVGERILGHLFAEADTKARQRKQVHTFVHDLCEMGVNGSSSQLQCLQPLVQQLTSCPRRHLDPQAKFTDFLFIMDQCLSPDEIESVFTKLAESFLDNQSHIFIHCARYFAYQKSYVKSLEITRKALELKDNDVYFSDTACTDDVVLSLSAHLINCRLASGPDMSFSDILSLALDSIRLCKRAQEKQRPSRMTSGMVYRAHPFCYEIQAQRLLLNQFFSIVCEKDYRRYSSELENQQYCAVKEAHLGILKNIFNLEAMHDRSMLEQDTLTTKEMQKLNTAKEEFIARYHPSDVSISDLKRLSPDPEVSDIAFAWTIVDCYVLKQKCAKEFDSREYASHDLDSFSSHGNFQIRSQDMWDRVWRVRNIDRRDIYERLLSIVESCKSKLTKNYFEACVLLILLQPKNAPQRALKLTNEWCEKFGDDVHARFLQGAFHLAFVLSCNDGDSRRQESLSNAKRAFGICRDYTILDAGRGQGRPKRSLPGRDRLRFVLRKGKQLDVLAYLPRKSSYEEQQKYIRSLPYQTFTGYLSDSKYLDCTELDSWRLHIPSKYLCEEQFKQKRRITFAIALAYSGPTPIIL